MLFNFMDELKSMELTAGWKHNIQMLLHPMFVTHDQGQILVKFPKYGKQRILKSRDGYIWKIHSDPYQHFTIDKE